MMMILLNLVIMCGAVVLALILAATASSPAHMAAGIGEVKWKKPSDQAEHLLLHEQSADQSAYTAHVAAAGMQ